MILTLEEIFRLEDAQEFKRAFEAYHELYNQDRNDFSVWRHFYFFLWAAIEDAPDSFKEEIDIQLLLQKMFVEGKMKFANNPEFNFIAGYTVSIFPYEYGKYEDYEREGNELLRKATRLQPDNPVYKMAYLGSIPHIDWRQLEKAELEAAPKVLEAFNGPGILNRYFRQVLYRVNKKY